MRTIAGLTSNRKTSRRQPAGTASVCFRSASIGRLIAAIAIIVMGVSPALFSQFGPSPQGHGPKLPAPTAFPASGTFPTTESVTLLDADPGAAIHYTLDGSVPTGASPLFDSSRLLFIDGFFEGNHGVRAGYTIRAVAIEQGHTNSDVADFEYTIDRRDLTTYTSEEVLPGVRMIRDAYNDKMFLIKGTKKCVLIDSGMGRGPLKNYVSQFTGGLPLIAIFTHNHFDHIGQADQFIRDSKEYIGEPDLNGLVRVLRNAGVPDSIIARNVVALHNGDRIDIGGRSLVIDAAPGHTPGSMVIFDPKTGNLFSGDAFGSNSPTIPDAAWLQFDPSSLDVYLAMIKNLRAQLGGRVRYVLTGHNDHPLKGETYLDNLERALQTLMDKGDAALVPSFRPPGLEQIIVGDRLHDPNWVAININRSRYLPARVNKMDGLTRIVLRGFKLTPEFTPEIKTYRADVPPGPATVEVTADPTSSRSTMTINGLPASAGRPRTVRLAASKIEIRVKSPDGTQTAVYTVTLSK